MSLRKPPHFDEHFHPTARLFIAVGVLGFLLSAGGAAAIAQPTQTPSPTPTETSDISAAPSADTPDCPTTSLEPTTSTPAPTTIPSTTTPTATPDPCAPLPSDALPSQSPEEQSSRPALTETPTPSVSSAPTEQTTPELPTTAGRLTTNQAQQQALTIESLTGTDHLAASDSLPLYLPKPALRAAVLATNEIGGMLFYNVPETSDIDAPVTSPHTVLYTADDGSADAFQATEVGQVRQALVIPANTQRIDRTIELNGGISLNRISDGQYEVLNQQGDPVGYIDHLRVRTATGDDVPAAISLDAGNLSIELQKPAPNAVYATWSFAAGSNEAEVVLE